MTMISIPVAPAGVALAVLLLGFSIPLVEDEHRLWPICTVLVAVMAYFFIYGLISMFS